MGIWVNLKSNHSKNKVLQHNMQLGRSQQIRGKANILFLSSSLFLLLLIWLCTSLESCISIFNAVRIEDITKLNCEISRTFIYAMHPKLNCLYQLEVVVFPHTELTRLFESLFYPYLLEGPAP